MTNSQPDPVKNNEPDNDRSNIDIVYDDGPGDTTVRPRGPEIPRDWPRPQLPMKEPPQPEGQ
jgi:hypothetical protein